MVSPRCCRPKFSYFNIKSWYDMATEVFNEITSCTYIYLMVTEVMPLHYRRTYLKKNRIFFKITGYIICFLKCKIVFSLRLEVAQHTVIVTSIWSVSTNFICSEYHKVLVVVMVCGWSLLSNFISQNTLTNFRIWFNIIHCSNGIFA